MHTPRMSRQGSGAGSFSDRSKPGNKFDVYIFNAFRKIVNVVCATFVRSRFCSLGHVRGTLACAVNQCLTDEGLRATSSQGLDVLGCGRLMQFLAGQVAEGRLLAPGVQERSRKSDFLLETRVVSEVSPRALGYRSKAF
mgnify:CR=1 FL=1|jgi:hypothetical protein